MTCCVSVNIIFDRRKCYVCGGDGVVVGSCFLVVFSFISAHECYNALLMCGSKHRKNSISLDEEECNVMPSMVWKTLHFICVYLLVDIM